MIRAHAHCVAEAACLSRNHIAFEHSDIPFTSDLQRPATIRPLLGALGGHHPGGFNAHFCDGSVRFLRESINLVVLQTLITRDQAEVITGDSF